MYTQEQIEILKFIVFVSYQGKHDNLRERIFIMQTFKNSNGKIIGKISGNVFVKKVKKSKHLLRKWNSWGIDQSVLDILIRDGIQNIKIHETENQEDYIVSVKDFAKMGISADFGQSRQIFLPLTKFDKENVK